MSKEIIFTEDQLHGLKWLVREPTNLLFFYQIKVCGYANYTRHYLVTRGITCDDKGEMKGHVENLTWAVCKVCGYKLSDYQALIIKGDFEDVIDTLNRLLTVFLDRSTNLEHAPRRYEGRRL